MAAKSQYRIPIESFEKAFVKMNFYRTKATPMALHYRRADALRVVSSSRMRKKGRSCQKVEREAGKGKITTIKVHKDDVLTHKTVKHARSDRDKLLSELTTLPLKI